MIAIIEYLTTTFPNDLSNPLLDNAEYEYTHHLE